MLNFCESILQEGCHLANWPGKSFGFQHLFILTLVSPRTELLILLHLHTRTLVCLHAHIYPNEVLQVLREKCEKPDAFGKDWRNSSKETDFPQRSCKPVRSWIPTEEKHNSEVVGNLSNLLVLKIPWTYMGTEFSLAFVNNQTRIRGSFMKMKT